MRNRYLVLHLVKSNPAWNSWFRPWLKVTASGPQDPFVPEWIGIQSGGMKQWISLELAKIRGISARLNFLFPGDLIQYFLDQQVPDQVVLDMDALVWAIYGRLDDHPPAPPLAPLAAYLKPMPQAENRCSWHGRLPESWMTTRYTARTCS